MSCDIKKLIVAHLRQECSRNINMSTDNKDVSRKLCNALMERKELFDKVFISHFNKNLYPVIQDGPQCGLVALALGCQFLLDNEISITELFEYAKIRGYTSKGEMFSCTNMARLWNEKTTLSADVVACEKQVVFNALLNGTPVLIPYDRDHNNEPCLSNGLKAHWALLTGMVLVLERSTIIEALLCESEYEQDQVVPNLYHSTSAESNLYNDKTSSLETLNTTNTLVTDNNVNGEDGYSTIHELDTRHSVVNQHRCDSADALNNSEVMSTNKKCAKLQELLDGTVYVYAWQGRSLRPHLWNLDQLLASNAQLQRVDPTILQWENGVVASTDCRDGLCGKFVLLHKPDVEHMMQCVDQL